MTVKELKLKIADLPDNMDVMLSADPEEGLYSMAETANVRKVKWQSEEIPKKEWPEENVLIISDEM